MVRLLVTCLKMNKSVIMNVCKSQEKKGIFILNKCLNIVYDISFWKVFIIC